MKKHFYSHVIDIESVHASLKGLDLTVEEQQELVIIVETSIHHVILDTVLSELSKEDKRVVLSHLAQEKHSDLWNLLTKKIDKVEAKIHKAVDDLKKDLHKDIQEAKNKEA